jgi:hypothetical protein
MQKKINDILIQSKNKADEILLYSESLNDVISFNDKTQSKSILEFKSKDKINVSLIEYKENKKNVKLKFSFMSKEIKDFIDKVPSFFIIQQDNKTIMSISFENLYSFKFKQKENSYILKYKIKRVDK